MVSINSENDHYKKKSFRVGVRLGEHNILTEKDCSIDDIFCLDPVQDIPVNGLIVHKEYQKSMKLNDIALIRLQTAANTTKNNVKTICLPLSLRNKTGVSDNELVKRHELVTGNKHMLLDKITLVTIIYDSTRLRSNRNWFSI